ncbi:hybrid sensor histidine kinase/response regulator transcription factor [Flammeovirga sp. OC4]|uniref:hybrid sensor histidine kinase/response regulator transcription factor n=1 Tax=Flammeovirga sp. OC4 TaxID=1382345 RepID=UPI0005C532F9|nr:hybrid sensor histidine kinase/response regulator transcription factor [Flammeovirga sp. OC4]
MHKLLLVILFFIVNFSYGKNIVQLDKLEQVENSPFSTINSIVEDQRGFIWFASWKGLYRYDGQEVVSFRQLNKAFLALKINDLHLFENDLWVSTNNNGIYRINLNDYSYENWSKSRDNFITDYSLCISFDQEGNQVWVGTQNDGLAQLNLGTNTIKVYDQKSEEVITNNTITCLLESNSKGIYLGTRKGILFKAKEEQHFSRVFEGINQYVYSMVQDPSGRIWVSERDGIYVTSKQKNKYTKIYEASAYQLILSKNKENILMSTNNGLKSINIFSLEVTSIEPKNEAIGMPISCALETEKLIWLGSRRKGLHQLYNVQNLVKKEESALNQLSFAVSNLCPLENGDLLFHRWADGIYYYQKSTDQYFKLKTKNFDQATLNTLTVDRYKKVWLSKKGNRGVYTFDLDAIDFERQTIKKIKHLKNPFGKEKTPLITTITSDKIGNVYFGTYTGDVYKYIAHADQFVPILFINQPFCKGKPIHSILVEEEKIWASTSGAGIFKAILDQDNTVLNLKNYTVQDGLSSNFCVTLFRGKNGLLWIGADDGLTVYDNQHFRQYFNTDDAFFSVESITEDQKGHIWLGTSKGLVNINPHLENENSRIFTTNDGLENKEFFSNSVGVTAEGQLMFGGTEGIDLFSPNQLDTKKNYAIPTVKEVLIGGEKVFYHSNEYVKSALENKAKIELPYAQNSIAFGFSNLEYLNQGKIQYAYKVSGLHKKWHTLPDGVSYLELNNLASGEYNIQVKSTNGEGVWSENTLDLQVVIAVPLWRHPVAIVLYVCLMLGLIYLFTQRKLVKAQHLHQLEIDRLDLQKKNELDDLRAKLYVNISHEFKTPLTLILGPLASFIQQKKENDPFFEQHLIMYNNADRLLKLVNRVINIGNSEQTKQHLNVEKRDFNVFIEEVRNAFVYEANRREIQLELEQDSAPLECYFDKAIVEDILFNLLSNALKYTPISGTIKLKVETEEEWLTIHVIDQGKGINPSVIDKIFDRYYGDKNRSYSTGIGLNYSKRLSHLHKGNLEVKNNKTQNGATFTLSLPLYDVYQADEKVVKDLSSNDTVGIYKNDVVLHQIETLTSDNLDSTTEDIALVIDDNPDIRTFVKSVLSGQFKVIEATNGKEGYDKAVECIPDIVISDVMMPEMDGFTLCDLIKKDERTDHIPIILTTVLSEHEDRLKGLKVGADSYIPKPLNPEHLLVRVEKLLNSRKKLIAKYSSSEKNTVENSPTEEHPLLVRAREIILQNVTNEDYDVDKFAVDLGFSRTQLYRKFKVVSDLSVSKFIRKIKLEKAGELLLEGELNIKQVTYEVGFNDLKYFRKCFQEQFGVTPSVYIKEHGEG